MSTITVTTKCGTSRTFDNRRQAERGRQTHSKLCDECTDEDIRIAADAGQSTLEASVADDDGSRAEDADPDALPTMPDSVRTDPLDVVPEYMITEIEGQPTINKRGYAVIASHFDIVVQSEAITTAGETDHEYAEFRATARKRSAGTKNEYTGHATARASEDRRGIENDLNEMAETRAMKRAVAWASGLGILAWEEMADSLVDE